MIKKFLEHRITKNASALIVLQIVNYISPLLILAYLTKKLGIETYGVIAFSIAITQLSWVLMDFGFSLSATQIISARRNDKKYISRYIGAIFTIKIIIFCVLSLCLFIYALTTEKYADYYLLFIFGLLPILGQAFQPIWFFSGIEEMKFSVIFMVIAKLLSLFFIYITISNKDDFLWVPISNGISQIIAAMIGIYYIYKFNYRIVLPRLKDINSAYKLSTGFFISRVSYVSYMQGGTIILGLQSTSVEVAIYSLVTQLYTVMQSIFMPISQASFPYMTKERNLPLYLKLTIGVFILIVLCSIVAYFLAPLLISIILGDQWGAAIPLFNIFLVAVIFNVLAIMSGYPLATALNKINVANHSVNFTAIFFYSMIFILSLYGMIHPINVGLVFLATEIHLFLHRSIRLWPLFFKKMKQEQNAKNL